MDIPPTSLPLEDLFVNIFVLLNAPFRWFHQEEWKTPFTRADGNHALSYSLQSFVSMNFMPAWMHTQGKTES